MICYGILMKIIFNVLANTLWCHQTTARWKIPDLNGGINWQTLYAVLYRVEALNWQWNHLDKDITTQKKTYFC